jgi:hypothetical protein
MLTLLFIACLERPKEPDVPAARATATAWIGDGQIRDCYGFAGTVYCYATTAANCEVQLHIHGGYYDADSLVVDAADFVCPGSAPVER